MRSQLSPIRELLEINNTRGSSSVAAAANADKVRSQSAQTASNLESNSLQNAPQAINEQMLASEPATATTVSDDIPAKKMLASEPANAISS